MFESDKCIHYGKVWVTAAICRYQYQTDVYDETRPSEQVLNLFRRPEAELGG